MFADIANLVAPTPEEFNVSFYKVPMRAIFDNSARVETYIWNAAKKSLELRVEHWGPPVPAAAPPAPAPSAPAPPARTGPCYDMTRCSGHCRNPLHTPSNIALSRSKITGMLWGDLEDDE